MTTRKPNVLYVFSDQQRASAIGCADGDEDLLTPNLDALAGEGLRMEAAVSNSPVCTPYRVMLMTGLYGHHTGVTTNNCYPDLSRHPHIGRTFGDAGYRCGYIGKWHVGEEMRLDAGHPMRLGFDDEWFVGVKGRHNNPNRDHAINSRETEVGEGLDRTEAETNRAIEFINRQDGETPWCLFLSWYPPHPPLVAPARHVEPYLGRDLGKHPTTWKLFHDEEIAGLGDNYAHYYGLISQVDAEFGRLMQALTECGQAEDTVVVFTSDHGEMLGSQGLYSKHWPYRESSQVPFLIRWPGKIEANSTMGMPFGSPDIFPTLCGLAGIDVPEGLDGVDCSGTLLGGKPAQDYVYLAMQHGYVAWPGWRGLRTERYNYARTEEAPWILFDLENDPFEENNLVGQNESLVAEMDTLLLENMSGCGDSWHGTSQQLGDWHLWPGRSQRTGGRGAVDDTVVRRPVPDTLMAGR